MAEPELLTLVVLSGPSAGLRLDLDRPILLGRDKRSKVPFDDSRVSRHHSLIERVGSTIVLRDLGSKNGTYVNGAQIRDFHYLKEHDQVRIGRTIMGVFAAEEAAVSDSRRAWETNPDPPTSEQDDAPDLHINREILRRATELTSRLAELCRGRVPLYTMVSTLRHEFEGDGAGVFSPTPPFDPLHKEGDIDLNATAAELLGRHVGQDPSWRSPALITHESQANQSLVAIPLRARGKVRNLLVVRRPATRPFGREHLMLAETLIECFRVLPLDQVLDSARTLPDHLGIVGSSDAIVTVREEIRRFAATSSTVLIVGESGTGKEVAARAIAELSPRRFKPYIEMNCACMSPDLVEAELFGAEKGAYTGLNERRLGKLELADGGTLFLDEIGELPPALQAKLLRVLEGQPFYRLGGNELIHADVRFLCATNRNLHSMVERQQFRADLFHRVNILQVRMPPLRDHVEDIPELVPYLVGMIQRDFSDVRSFEVTPHVYKRLLSWHWPGNVRELRNLLERCILLSHKPIIDEDILPFEMKSEDTNTETMPRLNQLIEMTEREEITRALLESAGNKAAASRALGISRPTLDKKIKQYGLGSLTSVGRENESADAEPAAQG